MHPTVHHDTLFLTDINQHEIVLCIIFRLLCRIKSYQARVMCVFNMTRSVWYNCLFHNFVISRTITFFQRFKTAQNINLSCHYDRHNDADQPNRSKRWNDAFYEKPNSVDLESKNGQKFTLLEKREYFSFFVVVCETLGADLLFSLFSVFFRSLFYLEN